jgi:head-tail adaptor
MTHTEEISVYKYTKTWDGFGAYSQGVAQLQTDAPTWATVNIISGSDLLISDRKETQLRAEILVNWRDDFAWTRDMYVVTRFGSFDVVDIQETERKRLIRLEGVLIG